VIKWRPTAEKREDDATSIFVNSEVEFLKTCSQYCGRRQVYVGYNPRPAKGDTKDEHIKRLVMLPFDLDAKHPKDEPATDAEIEAAATEELPRVKKWMVDHGLPEPYIDFTGNGFRIGEWCDLPVTSDLKDKLYGIFDAIKRDTGANLDNILNLSRIIKCPGTWSIKGIHTPERPHRLSYIINEGDASPEAIEKVNAFILSATPRSAATTAPPPSQPTGGSGDIILQAILAKDKKLANLFLGLDNAKYKSRSEAEAALATKLFIHRFNEADVRRLMSQARIGKWMEESNGYQDNTIKYAYSKAQEYLLEKEKTDAEKAEKNEKREGAVDKALSHFAAEHFATPDDVEQLYRYDAGNYVRGETYVKATIESLFENDTDTPLCRNIVDHLKRRSYVPRSEFNKFVGEIPVQNGVLNLETLELSPFTPDKIFTFKIQAHYKPDAKAPKWRRFMTQVLPNELDRAAIQEYLGSGLWPRMMFHKILFMVGEGRNGKGVIIRTTTSILGEDNVSNIKIDYLNGDHRFAATNLYGKLMNVSSEPSTRWPLQTELLKQLSGEDWFDGEVKGIQNPIRWKPFTKHVIQANKLPRVSDTSIGWWERVLIIVFEMQFLEDDGTQIPDIEDGWLTDEEERSGILNWLIEGWRRLKANGKFTKSKSQTAAMLEFKRKSDPAAAFFDEMCEFAPELWLTRAELYTSYKDYAASLNATIDGDKTFFKKVRALAGVGEGEPKIKGKTVRTFTGIGFKHTDEDDDPKPSAHSADSAHPGTPETKLTDYEEEKKQGEVTRAESEECAETDTADAHDAPNPDAKDANSVMKPAPVAGDVPTLKEESHPCENCGKPSTSRYKGKVLCRPCAIREAEMDRALGGASP